MVSFPNWIKQRRIRALLLDITGVLYDSSSVYDGNAILGSIEAVSKLQRSNLKIRFCSNESSETRQNLAAKLQRLGFELHVEQVCTPAPVAVELLKKDDLRPYFLINPEENNPPYVICYFDLNGFASTASICLNMLVALAPEFDSIPKSEPNAVVIGDAGEYFTYQHLNDAFRILMSSPRPRLISLGCGKYYKNVDGLMLDVGAFSKALEFACDIKAETIGKPMPKYYQYAIDSIGERLSPDEVVMIGDDILGDIAGAQAFGIRAILVRTGKFRPEWENHCDIKPDAIVNNLCQAVDMILQFCST